MIPLPDSQPTPFIPRLSVKFCDHPPAANMMYDILIHLRGGGVTRALVEEVSMQVHKRWDGKWLIGGRLFALCSRLKLGVCISRPLSFSLIVLHTHHSLDSLLKGLRFVNLNMFVCSHPPPSSLKVLHLCLDGLGWRLGPYPELTQS